ncbi:phenol hydroxylase [Ideonella oryzae]|uniref:Phenol hydroxylase n=1 Tax=Ideonella oryzae TaxID=2937441 RepID=A0ABT1BHR7_9BURK|nr:phenol hydroxylase [Ideonella oryzae]MCO5975469.1 phenol hydroxylase [Ideonella oryzae]
MNIDLQAREIQPLRHTFSHVAQAQGGDKPASRYLEATLGAQALTHFHYRPTWDPAHTLFDPARSAIRLADWNVLRDPRQYYYATWTMARARQQEAMEANFQFVEQRGLADRMPEAVKAQALTLLMPLRHVAWGGNMNNAAICAYGFGTPFTAPAMFHAMDQLGAAQYLTRVGLALGGPESLDEGKAAWMGAPAWQRLRHYVEDSFVEADPMALFVAQNLALDGLLYPLVYGALVDDHLSLQGGTAVAMLTAFMPEWHEESARWVDAVVKTAAAASEDNRRLLSDWARQWGERAKGALAPVAEMVLGETAQTVIDEVWEAWQARCTKAGLAL